jgi:tripartite-type tricarboxylate transporter receptor subunit TctC
MRTNESRKFLMVAAALAAALFLPTQAAAQANLPKTITVVVPFAPRGGTDLFARQVAQRFAARTGSNVIVDNRAGAGGMIGAEYVSRAPADGSIVMITASDLSVSIATKKTLPFDAAKGLTTAAILASGPMLLVVNAQSPYKTIGELLQGARDRKDQIHYGSAGIGSLHHLTLELLNSMAGLQMTHVPYNGSAAAVTDLTADRIQVLVGSFPTTWSHIKAGKLRPLAVTSAKPSRFAPELPTVGASVPGFDVDIWWGVFVPGATPQPVVERLNADMRAVVASADMREVFERDGVHPGALPAAESAKLVRDDIEKWREVARRQNIIVE